MSNDEVFAFWVGAFCAVVVCFFVFALANESWATARNTMMAQCTEQHTYESCIDAWNGKTEKSKLVPRAD